MAGQGGENGLQLRRSDPQERPVPKVQQLEDPARMHLLPFDRETQRVGDTARLRIHADFPVGDDPRAGAGKRRCSLL